MDHAFRSRLFLALLAAFFFPLAACKRTSPNPEVILYSSVDQPILRPILAVFEKESGITVKLVGDTEATKTTGLVERFLLERDKPQADVWWSNEALGTVFLSSRALFSPHQPPPDPAFPSGWPPQWRDPDNAWHAFALRARVIAFNSERIKRDDAPRTLRDLTDPRYKGRIGIARPQFGTTRAHMAWLYATRGQSDFRAWLVALRANGVRLYDGNSAVVRALSVGEIDLGLTDSDDVYAAREQNWPVDHVFESTDPATPDAPGLRSLGPLVIPNTAARVKDGPNPAAADRLLNFILSERVERLLAQSEAHNLPIRPNLAPSFAAYAIPETTIADWAAIAAAQTDAMRACDEILGH